MNYFGKDSLSPIVFPPPEYPPSDRLVSQDWVIEYNDCIAEGSTANVYDCWNKKDTGKLFVAKRYTPSASDLFKTEVAAFLRAKGLPYLVKMHDYGRDCDWGASACPVIVEERVRGERVFTKGKVWKTGEKLIMLFQYLDLLEELKQQGIINLDPKMDNLFYDSNDVAITAIDLGNVRFALNRSEADQLMRENLFRGSRKSLGVSVLAEEILHLFEGQTTPILKYVEAIKESLLPPENTIPRPLQAGMVKLLKGQIDSITQLKTAFRAERSEAS